LAQGLWDGRANKLEIRKALGNTVVNVLDGIKAACITGFESGPYNRESMQRSWNRRPKLRAKPFF